MPVKLTKRTADAAKVASARKYIFDSELPGFGLMVTPNGAKSFFVQYRTAGGRRGTKRRVTLGGYGKITAEEARLLAKQLLATVAQGSDPATTRNSHKTAPRVVELGEDFLTDVTGRVKASTSKEYQRLWRAHVLPSLGPSRVAEVSIAQVANLHRRLSATPYNANRVLALLGSFFSFAEQQGARPKHTNPAHEVKAYREHSRERFLSPTEVIRLGAALTRAETVGVPPAPTRRRKRKTGVTAKHRPKSVDYLKPANPFAVAAIRFLLLSGWREREALNLRWNEIDTSRRVATLPDTKTGRSIRPLGAPALALLDELPRIDDSPYVFPGREPKQPLVEINRVWYAVRLSAGLEDVRLHDLRHSFASAVASSGGSLLIIRELLGHKDTSTTAKYAHLFGDPVKATADATAAQIAEWLRQGDDVAASA
jgi:integrase